MWIESHPTSTVRRRFVSPLGYQSPMLGDSVPVPGSQGTQRKTLQPRVSTSSLSRVPRLFTTIIATSRTRREANNGHKVSHRHFILGVDSEVDPEGSTWHPIHYFYFLSNFLAIIYQKQRSFINWTLPWTLKTVPEHCHQQEKHFYNFLIFCSFAGYI